MSAATIESRQAGGQPIGRMPLEDASPALSGSEEVTGRAHLRVVPEQPTRPSRRRRPGRGSGRRAHPAVRPAGAVPPPVLDAPTGGSDHDGVGARACRVEAAAPAVAPAAARPAASRWRLTDRGIGVVLVAGAMLVAAAVTVITATALTVTSESYQPTQVISIGR